ncbi:uncharacterized protein LOC143152423 [Ptiloglossa arizonensis]|uniref:uncharacterized protein LOC143152423 n=1 Tax=Ptiloglossa arizonensis TaxID=3350558 RepID=UPI003FA0CE6A
MKLLFVFALVALAAGHPGLLRVPKVYNAVITSNQNLSPSRAFPVIQPVVHRTAVGYVPPFYYKQGAPHVSGPELMHLPQTVAKPGGEADVQTELSVAVESSKLIEIEEKKEATDQHSKENKNESRSGSRNKQEDQQQPLSFYPNYQSLYYDPYFYTYNGINPHLVPGTYYVGYQPYGTLEPIPASTPKSGLSGHLLPGYHEEKKDVVKLEEEKVRDVPPPALPTAASKSP